MLNPIAFAQFAWDQVSIPDKAELELHGMHDCMWNLQAPLISISDILTCCSPRLILWANRQFPTSKTKRSLSNYADTPGYSSRLCGLNLEIEVQCEYRAETLSASGNLPGTPGFFSSDSRIWRPRPRPTRNCPVQTSEDCVDLEREC